MWSPCGPRGRTRSKPHDIVERPPVRGVRLTEVRKDQPAWGFSMGSKEEMKSRRYRKR